MRNVSLVGRIGALAIALGVASALGTMPPPALAQPADSTSSSTTSAESSDSSPGPESSPSDQSPSASNSASPEKDSSDASAATGDSAPEDESATADPDTASETAAESMPAGESTPTPAEASSPSAGTAVPQVTAPTPTPAPSQRSDQRSSRTALPTAPKRVTAAPALPDASTSAQTQWSPTSRRSTTTTPSTTLRPPTVAESAAAALPNAATTTTETAVVQSDPAPTKDPSRNIVTRIVSTLLGWMGLGPSTAQRPSAPIHTPMLWTVLAGVGREIEKSLLNLTRPTGKQHLNSLIIDPLGPNLLTNAGAELGDPSLSGYSSVTVPGWTVTGTPTVIKYDTLRRQPSPFATPGQTLPRFLGFPRASSGPPDGGAQFFGGGNVATSALAQTVDLHAAAADIDGGAVPYSLSGWLGGFGFDPSAAGITVEFLDANQLWLGTGKVRPVNVFDRWFGTKLLERGTSGTIPVGTRSARVVVTLKDNSLAIGTYNNAYADNVSFTVGAALPAPPPPTPPASTVGELDHVFMLYLENKGYTDIVGSPNAPYLNSIINAYGFGSNYYALTHPSDPNYYPILGGSDFGTNYNCPVNCFDQPNLADNIEAAGKTWAGYVEGMPFPGARESAPGYAPDSIPFLAFSDIYNDPARAAAHLFPLTQMAADLASTATAPNFVWFAANDATNMEGPVGTFAEILAWTWSQLTDHQYNVKAGDKWLQDTLPIILNSAVWQDPTQKSAIILTFDEDYDNLSLGIGNQGNHIPTIVIPSAGAVASGMRSGHFIADDYNNHYSLLRTIEESLGLPTLTNNDKFANPMNEYWV